jgi:hypothetical protein
MLVVEAVQADQIKVEPLDQAVQAVVAQERVIIQLAWQDRLILEAVEAAEVLMEMFQVRQEAQAALALSS